MNDLPKNAMKGIRRRKILEHREPLAGEKRQRVFWVISLWSILLKAAMLVGIDVFSTLQERLLYK